ncbi:hypothetical protein M3M35_06950 [Fructilactobacillus myrtifloralis]|uniref:Carrier domain-containing protein n=1 Tax=Fructilactobacillus myrtifloralis TaxID=2940301 RepID=A0ABY5BR05_9LACO|nr:hypothetical protein [Fructilactobacillus myrtifloralis]USS85016.1 hypothetical protein M3M35_06930 [Fructilactobacillus myrtifloralis]USS85020.1 hypothetical protein M3M35_06950 [Fructilactobacillus myrtifloralis]
MLAEALALIEALMEALLEALLIDTLASLADFELALAEADLLVLIDVASEKLVDFEALSEALLIEALTDMLCEPGCESYFEMLSL